MLRLKKADSFQSFIEGLGYKTGRSENTRNVVIGKLTEFGIDYKLYLKGRAEQATNFNTIPDEEYYAKGKFRGSQLGRRVRRQSKIPYCCSICTNNGSWLGGTLTLQLDHIDGDNTNNELVNLRWLCPNCHTQTNTYSNKARK